MNVEAFRKSRTGELITVTRSPSSYVAFVPSALPPELSIYDADLLQTLSQADRSIGELAGVGRIIPNPDLLVIPYMTIEALASSRIEGTQASLSDLFIFEAASEKKPNDDVQEVLNYLNALRFGLTRLKTLPLSLRFIREVHEKLMRGVRGGTPDKTPGEFRRSQNWIGSAGATLQQATYVPPPPDKMLELLHNFELYLHADTTLPFLVFLAVVHYQFEVIHPFLDGNGRLGRLLLTFLLCSRNELPQPLLYLSRYFELHQQTYYDKLIGVSRDGDWLGWLTFSLEAVRTQSRDAIEKANRILEYREQKRRELLSSKVRPVVLAVFDSIFLNPYVSVALLSERTSFSYNTLNSGVGELLQEGTLRLYSDQKRNRIFVAHELLRLLEDSSGE